MSGTNHTAPATLGGPCVILVEPQLGENIGAAARAMLNCGLTELRLVSPRDGWPNPAAAALASGADQVLAEARVYDHTEAATADLHRVYATTARLRDQVKPVVTPRQAAQELRAQVAAGLRVGLLFGPERTGLSNDDLLGADAVLHIPLNPSFSSLNLAMAVLLTGYAWYETGDETLARYTPDVGAPPATHGARSAFLQHLEQALDAAAFFRVPEKRAALLQTIRALFSRVDLTAPEVSILHGIVTALSGRRLDGRARGAPRDAPHDAPVTRRAPPDRRASEP